MLARPQRLTAPADFRRIQASGRGASSPYFRIAAVRGRQPGTRLAVVVGTKVSKKATDRNRLRRQIREVLRTKYTRLAPGNDIVIWVRSACLGKPAAVLADQLGQVLHRSHLLA